MTFVTVADISTMGERPGDKNVGEAKGDDWSLPTVVAAGVVAVVEEECSWELLFGFRGGVFRCTDGGDSKPTRLLSRMLASMVVLLASSLWMLLLSSSS